MFTNIKTSKNNKDIVTNLTQKLNLGAENIIARLAFSYSLSRGRPLDLSQIKDSSGKEYNSKVLFGNYMDTYIALICVYYRLHKSDKDIAKYVKLHIDDGLELINREIINKDSVTGLEFLMNEVEKGLAV